MTMNQSDKDIIRRNYTKLAGAISPQVEEVIDCLYEQQIISKHMKENLIEGNNTKRRRATALLDIITTRGPKAFDCLYTALKEEQLFEAADILKPGQASNQGSDVSSSASKTDEYESPDESLPENWPSEEANDAYKNLQIVKHARMKALFNKSLTPAGQEHTYLMAANPRGRVLIINNDEFDTFNKRDGTVVDRRALETLFRDLYFDVHVEKDKTKEDMLKLLKEEANNEHHKHANCFILFILSHGHTGVVFGTDGALKENKPINCIDIKTITDIFCKSKFLGGKPKLFFIQACQGELKNVGEPVGEADSSNSVPSSKQDTPPASSTTNKDGSGMEKTDGHQEDIIYNTKKILEDVLPTTESDSVGGKRPSGADVFVAVATVPGFLSWRNTKHGTWFIQAIVYIFAKFAYKYDLNSLMTKVNNLVGRGETEKQYKQVGEKKDSFQKAFYFFPGLHVPQSDS